MAARLIILGTPTEVPLPNIPRQFNQNIIVLLFGTLAEAPIFGKSTVG